MTIQIDGEPSLQENISQDYFVILRRLEGIEKRIHQIEKMVWLILGALPALEIISRTGVM